MYYIVGGYVRDMLMGRTNSDIDYAMEVDDFQTMRSTVQNMGFKIYNEHPEFYTIKAGKNKKYYDFVMCRKDGYYLDNRHPVTVDSGTIYDDLSRRDFTMNALAIKIRKDEIGKECFQKYEIIDPYGGIDDINNSTIKCVGETITRLTEDPLRIIRALRFKVTLGFEFDDELNEILNQNQNITALLKKIPDERILNELDKMFKYNSNQSLLILAKYPYILAGITSNNIWFKPTNKKK